MGIAAGAVYPLIMLTAVASGALLLRWTQQSLLLPAPYRIAIGLSAFCGAMLGAKLPFALSDWPGLLDGSVWFSNGKTIVCGMVGAYFAVELAKWALGVRTKTGDSFVIPVATAIAIGRLGCLYAGCCYGVASKLPWAMQCSVADDTLRHPTQLYESGFHLSMALLAAYMIRNKICRGQIAKLYIICYLVYRFVTEFIRPETQQALGLTNYQWFCLAMVPIFGYLWYHDVTRQSQLRQHIMDNSSIHIGEAEVAPGKVVG